jgi:hypothetical protein
LNTELTCFEDLIISKTKTDYLPCETTLQDKAYQIEEFMLDMPQVEIPISHTFCNGMYARTGMLPAGMAFSGGVYKEDYIVVISEGDHAFVTDNSVTRVQGPCVLMAKAGIKRIGYSYTDTYWTSIHKVKSTTVDDVEEELWLSTEEEFDEWVKRIS